MAHAFRIVAEVSVERESGKFASREEIAEQLVDLVEAALDGETLHGLGADGDSVYEVAEVTVEEE